MKRKTLKWRIFKYNLLVIVALVAVTMVIFNLAVRGYIEQNITSQLKTIAFRAEDTALHRFPNNGQGLDALLHGGDGGPPPTPKANQDTSGGTTTETDNKINELIRFYLMMDRSLREPLSLLNADYILLDGSRVRIPAPQDDLLLQSEALREKILGTVQNVADAMTEITVKRHVEGTDYIAIIKPVTTQNSFGLGWIIIYANVGQINQTLMGINGILLLILLLSALVVAFISSRAARNISAPFSILNRQLSAIAERDFDTRLTMPVDEELQSFVTNINTLSDKLRKHDQAQKTFLQNASHEFRTPLMSIRSHAEGIRHQVIDTETGVRVILDESDRMTHLVEDLLYLSRLEAIEERGTLVPLRLDELLSECVDRMNLIASAKEIHIHFAIPQQPIWILGDGNRLARAFINLLDNGIRHAGTQVCILLTTLGANQIQVDITDDGPGFGEADLPHVFERFYKGQGGHFGLGLAITRQVIEMHEGTILASNTGYGALFRIVFPLYVKAMEET